MLKVTEDCCIPVKEYMEKNPNELIFYQKIGHTDKEGCSLKNHKPELYKAYKDFIKENNIIFDFAIYPEGYNFGGIFTNINSEFPLEDSINYSFRIRRNENNEIEFYDIDIMNLRDHMVLQIKRMVEVNMIKDFVI